jgi:hypothetical protein
MASPLYLLLMLPIETCLDILLLKLKESWEHQDRPQLDAEAILKQFEIPRERHEFFKGLMRMIIEDKYAYPITPYNSGNPSFTELDHLTKRVMLTPLGFYFIERGGYGQQELDRRANARKLELENSRNQLNQILLVIGAIGAAVGAIGLILWEMYKYFCLEKH